MMFEAAEVGSKIDKATYREHEPRVRAELLEVQREIPPRQENGRLVPVRNKR